MEKDPALTLHVPQDNNLNRFPFFPPRQMFVIVEARCQ